jgi:hypothetical protein
MAHGGTAGPQHCGHWRSHLAELHSLQLEPTNSIPKQKWKKWQYENIHTNGTSRERNLPKPPVWRQQGHGRNGHMASAYCAHDSSVTRWTYGASPAFLLTCVYSLITACTCIDLQQDPLHPHPCKSIVGTGIGNSQGYLMTTLTPLRMQRPSVLLHHHHIHAKQECFDDVLQIDLIVQTRQPAPENF